MRRLRLSIRDKLVAIVLATSALSLSAGFAFVMANDVRTFRRDLVDSAVLTARIVGQHSVAALAFQDRDEALRTLGHLAAVPEVESASLYDADGNLFASYGPAADERPAEARETREFRGRVLHVSEPVEHDGITYGALHVSLSTRSLDEKLRRRTLVLLAVLASLIVLSVAFAWRLQRIISVPMLRLAETARWVSQAHDYSVRVEQGTADDEIGVLSEGFNQMLAEIEKRQNERDAADRRTREKSQFLANMSHELRTPLNAIIGFSEVLIDRLAGRLNEREAKFLRNIHTSGRHLLGIVNDILDLSKVEAGRMEVVPETLALAAAVESVCGLMRGISAKRNVSFTADVPADLEVVADIVKVKQILYNLLANAVRYSPEHATVSISARPVAADRSTLGVESVELSVRDQGPGIAPAEQAVLFQEYRQAEGARGAEGTGLGLALVRKFAQLHGGTAHVESTPGRGSTFVVLLPRVCQPASVVASSEPAVPGDDRPRILVIEGEAAAYEAIRDRLLSAGFSPAWARGIDEALRLARTLTPVAITLDLALPEGGAWELLRRLKSQPETRDVPLVVVSVRDDRELGLALGADDYFVKPVDLDDLVRRLGALAPAGPPQGPILLIDDDRDFHELLEARLASHGHVLLHAYSGAEGLREAAARQPALVVLDLMMDGMDGFEVAVRLRADPRTSRLPILVLTAKRTDHDDVRRLRGRIDALLGKAELSGPGLASVIQELLARAPARRSS